MQDYSILLFYKYVKIDDPKKLMDEQKGLCERLDIKGRIIVAEEGINATMEGTTENIKEYLRVFLSDLRFADTHIKKSKGIGDAFPRLSVKVRPELVTLKYTKKVSENSPKGKVIMPEELKEWYKTKKINKDFYIVDFRNDYEFKVGKFKDSITPPLKNFRDLQDILPNLEDLKDKEVITVCTGDVRCDKAADFLTENGFKNAYHLDGGIVTYMQKYPAQEFEGSLYVFDKRILVHFDPEDKHIVLGRCDKCEKPSERYVNCKNPRCNKHFICCESCAEEDGRSFCSTECKNLVLVSK